MRLNFIISDSDHNIVNLLREGLAGCEEVSVLELKPDRLLKLENVDALYLTATGAERWGAYPMPHRAQVLRTTAADAEKGYPPFVVAGGVFNLDDPRDPRFQLRAIMNAVILAVEAFNSENNGVIRTVAFWTEWICIPSINPVEAGEIIKSVYQQHYPDS
jgi:hypothetical protein